MKTFNVGQKVVTEWGNGVIIGFERFGEDGWSAPHSHIDDGVSRVVVMLDSPEKFLRGEYGNPFMFRSEIKIVGGAE